ncbi:CRTAC1 family protein [Stieleria sp. JC731]|uniref:CRTAC1 family protein n=1 Tax=Pirellulaceae TaxID=2691357 RepID=UPI001E4498DE|nr:CRTAC1 family protein [Stieleria sp. JC731]MCC9599159.1 CRTAC1 family protein [Stieleria sp. JC731]
MSRSFLAFAFAGLLFGPAAYFRWADKQTSEIGHEVVSQDSRLQRYGFSLREVASDVGVDFVHQPPKIDARLDHIGPQVAAMGASVSVVDVDRDGWLDFYLTSSAPDTKNCFFRNKGDGTFDEIAEQLGLADLNVPGTGACMGSVWGDIDNDGFDDVLVYKWGKQIILKNHQGKRFEPIDQTESLPQWANIGSATWLDYDRDGYIDLFLAGYWPNEVQLEELRDTRIMPESFEYADNGGGKWLLRNNRQGGFEDVTKEVGLDSKRWTLAVIAADLNGDSFADLFLANDYGVSEIYVNESGKRFREVGKEAGVGYSPKSGMNAAIGDVLNDGRFSIYESNISEEGVLLQGNNLWFPASDGTFKFQNLASVMGVEIGGWSFGAQFGDLNNDGFTDLYVTNGYVSGDRGTSYWYDFSQITGGHEQIISDAMNWPDMQGRSLAGYQSKRVWLNDGAGKFRDVAQWVGVTDRYDGRAVALADFRNQGTLDIVVANQCDRALLYQNTISSDRHWIAIELKGTVSNRNAIGAQVRVFWDGQQQLQERVAASGYSAQNQSRLHFGLGSATAVDRIVVRWPSGNEQTIQSPAIDKLHLIEEPK